MMASRILRSSSAAEAAPRRSRAAMGTSFAVVFQTVGLAALLEAERAARSIAAHSPALVAAKRLELVAVGDAATLRGRSAGLTRAVDVAALVPAPLAARVAAAARRGGGACRRATCAVDDVRAVREARAAALPALLRAFAPLLALDADSVACGSLEPLLRWGAATPFDVALRPVPAAVAKGPARAVPSRAARNSHLQPDFNVRVIERINESDRSVQKSAESTSIRPSSRISKFGRDVPNR